MKRTLLAALMCLLFLSGCAGRFAWPDGSSDGPAQTGPALTVYRVAVSGENGAPGGELLGQELCPLPSDAPSEIEAAIELLAAPSGTEGLVSPLWPDVTVEGWSQEGSNLTLRLSESFLTLEDMDRTAAAFCAAMTLCALDGVESVSVSVGGQTLFSGLTPADALLRDTDTDPYVRQLRLYFADAAGRYLVSEYRSLTLDEDASAERYVLEELLRGPNNAELQSVIPEGTKLLSCRTEDGLCTVDLSGAFYEDRPDTALGERLVICSIVNSLTALPQVDSVALLVEGEALDTYVFRPLDRPLTRYDAAVGPVAADRGETDTDLYLAPPGLDAIVPLPWRITPENYDSAPEAVLAALLSAAEPDYPTLFSGSGTVGNVTLRETVCTVDVSESFFASLTEEARPAAVQSMAASLCALDEVDSVVFTIAGQPAVFDGVDWSGPWSGFALVR